MLAAVIVAARRARGAGPALAAKDVVFAVASTFTTTDPYDANDTLSQAMAKSFYEGLFGFDKDMKMIPVLAESYDGQQGRPRLHDQAQEGHQVPRRHRLQGRRGQGELRPRDQSRQQAQALRPVQQHRQDRGRRRLHGAHHAEDAVLARSSTSSRIRRRVMISPTALKQVRQQGHRLQPGRHRPVQVRRVEADRLPQGREVRRLLEEGLPEGRHDHLEAGRRQQHARGDDADRRGALHLPGAVRAWPRC